ncbi:hypothetical protein DENSPDRAFT_158730 [Dentipellis sp. KUC8613]|nr:hypothetical protein DENSPDRAFT_158730 [Dentipellis sp. KUC8613]
MLSVSFPRSDPLFFISFVSISVSCFTLIYLLFLHNCVFQATSLLSSPPASAACIIAFLSHLRNKIRKPLRSIAFLHLSALACRLKVEYSYGTGSTIV